MEQSFNLQRNQQQGVLLEWTHQSVLPNEAGEAPSRSASSVVIFPGSRKPTEALSDSTGLSSSSLKERDYIGLSEVSSTPSLHETERHTELKLAETDLRLGLGPVSEASFICSDKVSESLKNETPDTLPNKTLTICHNPDETESAFHVRDDANAPHSIAHSWHNIPVQSTADVIPAPRMNGIPSNALTHSVKNGGKRMYAEAMVDVPRDRRSIMNLNSSSGAVNVCDPRSYANQSIPSKTFQDQDKRSHALHPQGVRWIAPCVSSWQAQANYRSVASQTGMVFTSVAREKDNELSQNAKLDVTYRNNSSLVHPKVNEGIASDDAPPAKGQVIGWPPVRSYRRSTLGTRPKPIGDEGDSSSAIFVKVNMEGIPIGRKVDLNAYESYDGLLSALEDMFHNPNSGLGAQFLKGSEFVLTYEDKEGDWMLVGDVPWGMFVNTVKRLRITRGSEMTGSKTSCHA